MKGDVISGQSLMLWFQKDSLDIVGFGTFIFFYPFPYEVTVITVNNTSPRPSAAFLAPSSALPIKSADNAIKVRIIIKVRILRPFGSPSYQGGLCW